MKEEKGWCKMVRVYDIRHIKDGTELIKDPLHLKSAQIKSLEQRRNEVALDTEYMTQAEAAIVYSLGERTGIPVVQRSYDVDRCPYEGVINYNDGEYVGGRLGLHTLLSTLFEKVFSGTQEEIDQLALM